ncbi:MAG: hypothetical protein JKY37_00485 [Nannocystaceae bacterium]|nr:hypothetical protein [Nannocystaceae bacterium]
MVEVDKPAGAPPTTPQQAAGAETGDASPEAAPPAGPSDPLDDVPDPGADDVDFGPPFSPKTFGASLVWARGANYVCTVLRVKEGENVVVSTQGRIDMNVMLTGGRAVLEVGMAGGDIDRVELLPASPVPIAADRTYRLLAVTEVELFTVYSPLPT